MQKNIYTDVIDGILVWINFQSSNPQINEENANKHNFSLPTYNKTYIATHSHLAKREDLELTTRF